MSSVDRLFESLTVPLTGFDDAEVKEPSDDALLIPMYPDTSVMYRSLAYLGLHALLPMRHDGAFENQIAFLAPNEERPGRYTDALLTIAALERCEEIEQGSYGAALQAALSEGLEGTKWESYLTLEESEE